MTSHHETLFGCAELQRLIADSEAWIADGTRLVLWNSCFGVFLIVTFVALGVWQLFPCAIFIALLTAHIVRKRAEGVEALDKLKSLLA